MIIFFSHFLMKWLHFASPLNVSIFTIDDCQSRSFHLKAQRPDFQFPPCVQVTSLTRCKLFPQAEDWLRQFLLPVSSKELVKVSHLLNYIDTCKLNKPGTYTHICTHRHTPVNIMVTQRVKAGPVYKQGLRSLEGRRMRCPAPQELVLSLLSAQRQKEESSQQGCLLLSPLPR